MLVFPDQVRSVVGSVALVVVVACVVVFAAASAVASEVDMRHKGLDATSRAKTSMRTIQDLTNLVAMVVMVVFVWIVMVGATAEATAEVTSSLSQASKSWFAM